VPVSTDRAAKFPAGLRAGDIIAGRYRLEEVIGSGGMGVVVAAHHVELDERVAVKFLSPAALADPEATARFDREVRAAARLRNEHIARVYDAGKLPDGARYMVLEYLDGEDLAAKVRREGPLEPSVAVRYLLQACSAVLEAHGKGIIHRDIKPANLFVIGRPDGADVVKILDFGVMKRIGGAQPSADPQQTEPGTIIGTPFYTSPEQLRGSASVDGRTDIWALGATLYELLSATPPFPGKTYAQIIANVLEAAPTPLVELRPNVPRNLANVVMRCLEKDPADRYQSVVDLAIALADTVELDSEQMGLLERIVRHGLVSSPFASASVLNTPISMREASPSSVGTKPYLTTSATSRRVMLVGITTLVTAAAVVLLGLPWIPDFRASAPAKSTHSAFTSSAEPSQTSLLGSSTGPSAAPSAARNAEVPAAAPPVAETSPRPIKPNSPSNGPRIRHKTTTTSVRAPEPVASESPAAQSGEKKNPLLVRPRD
jgi:serine/threonine-protein kinase